MAFSPVEEPRLTIREAEVFGVAGHTSVRLLASAYNPNTFPIALRHATVELDIEGRRVGSSLGPIARTLPPRRPIAFQIVQPLDVGGRHRAVIDRGARYRVRGILGVGAPDRAFDVPYRHEGMMRAMPY